MSKVEPNSNFFGTSVSALLPFNFTFVKTYLFVLIFSSNKFTVRNFSSIAVASSNWDIFSKSNA